MVKVNPEALCHSPEVTIVSSLAYASKRCCAKHTAPFMIHGNGMCHRSLTLQGTFFHFVFHEHLFISVHTTPFKNSGSIAFCVDKTVT